MNLKNYTSTVPASTSMAKIEECLVKAGATDISKKYNDGMCTVCDWVEIQLTMIQLEQAEAIEIFLPYVYNPATEKTFYQDIQERGYKGLIGIG